MQAIGNTVLTFRYLVCCDDSGRVSAEWRVAVAEDQRGVGSVAGYLAIVMLGTPTRGTSLTVIWNKRYSIWKASRFQRASGPVVFTA